MLRLDRTRRHHRSVELRATVVLVEPEVTSTEIEVANVLSGERWRQQVEVAVVVEILYLQEKEGGKSVISPRKDHFSARFTIRRLFL